MLMPSQRLTPVLMVQFCRLLASKVASSPGAGACPWDQLDPVFQLWSEAASALQTFATDGIVRSSSISSLGRTLILARPREEVFFRLDQFLVDILISLIAKIGGPCFSGGRGSRRAVGV